MSLRDQIGAERVGYTPPAITNKPEISSQMTDEQKKARFVALMEGTEKVSSTEARRQLSSMIFNKPLHEVMTDEEQSKQIDEYIEKMRPKQGWSSF
jgi:cytochrome c553